MTWRTRQLAGAAAGIALAGATVFCGGPEFTAGTEEGDSSAPDTGGGADTSAPDAVDTEDGSSFLDSGHRQDANGRRDGSGGDDGGDGTTGGGGADDAAGSTDAADAGEVVFSCANQDAGTLIFCCDFEGIAALSPPWSGANATGGSNELETTLYKSPTHGYLASTTASFSVMGTSNAFLTETITTTSNVLDVAFSVYAKAISTTANGSATLASLAIGDTTPRQLTLALVVDSSGVHLEQTASEADGGTATESDPLTGLALGATTWDRVRITLDRSNAAPEITVTLNETKAYSFPSIATTVNSDMIAVDLGLIAVTATGQADSVGFDDVLVRGL